MFDEINLFEELIETPEKVEIVVHDTEEEYLEAVEKREAEENEI